MEKVETRGKEVRKCRWEETVRCPRLVGQFSNAGVAEVSVAFKSNFGDSKQGYLDKLVMPVLAMFCHLPKQLRFEAGQLSSASVGDASCVGKGDVDCNVMH